MIHKNVQAVHVKALVKWGKTKLLSAMIIDIRSGFAIKYTNLAPAGPCLNIKTVLRSFKV